MIPLSDTVRPRNFPLVNWILILTSTLIFLYEISLSPAGLEDLFQTYALIPAKLPLHRPAGLLENPFILSTLFTSMFLHGGWFHFLSNVWVLHIFGDNVEDRMGHIRYLLFYLLSGATAGWIQTLMLPSSGIPTIGASGAIAGVMGAYILFFPTARILTLIPVFFIPWFIRLPAFFFLGFWFISQIYSGLFSLALPPGTQTGGVAWWAHIGGFLFGLAFARYFARRLVRVYREPKHEWADWPPENE
jgi:membrane associated rhomboid family serine protease